MVIVVTFTEFAIGGANMCSHVCLRPSCAEYTSESLDVPAQHLCDLWLRDQRRRGSLFPELQLTSDTNTQHHHISLSLSPGLAPHHIATHRASTHSNHLADTKLESHVLCLCLPSYFSICLLLIICNKNQHHVEWPQCSLKYNMINTYLWQRHSCPLFLNVTEKLVRVPNTVNFSDAARQFQVVLHFH